MVGLLGTEERRVATDLGAFVEGLSLPIEVVERRYPSSEEAGRDFAVHVAAAILDFKC